MEKLLTAKDVAALLSVSLSQVYALIEAGKIRPFRLSARGRQGGIRFNEQMVKEMLEASQAPDEDEGGGLKYIRG